MLWSSSTVTSPPSSCMSFQTFSLILHQNIFITLWSPTGWQIFHRSHFLACSEVTYNPTCSYLHTFAETNLSSNVTLNQIKIISLEIINLTPNAAAKQKLCVINENIVNINSHTNANDLYPVVKIYASKLFTKKKRTINSSPLRKRGTMQEWAWIYEIS